MDSPGVIQIVMHDAMRPAFEQWLAARGLFLFLMPPEAQAEDDLPTYGIGFDQLPRPTEETGDTQ